MRKMFLIVVVIALSLTFLTGCMRRRARVPKQAPATATTQPGVQTSAPVATIVDANINAPVLEITNPFSQEMSVIGQGKSVKVKAHQTVRFRPRFAPGRSDCMYATLSFVGDTLKTDMRIYKVDLSTRTTVLIRQEIIRIRDIPRLWLEAHGH